jgi:hypothetical protein
MRSACLRFEHPLPDHKQTLGTDKRRRGQALIAPARTHGTRSS